jgi:uncharacterized DUF497 family protein
VVFAWDEKNREHLLKHSVKCMEAEYVVENAVSPFPQEVGDGKRRVWGATAARRLLQVVYVLKEQSDVAFASVDPHDWTALQNKPDARIVRVIHAMDLTPDMKGQLRQRRR